MKEMSSVRTGLTELSSGWILVASMLACGLTPGQLDGRTQNGGDEAGSICGTDDRQPSSDPAVGRLIRYGVQPGTAFLLPNGKLVTAGHLFDQGGDEIWVEFNVPLSDPTGAIQAAADSDRYLVRNESRIWRGQWQAGNDWGVFEVYANSITGKLPLEAQRASYSVVRGRTPSQVRLTGYGRASGVLNYTQQTSADAYAGRDGYKLFYWTDVQQGSSGSPAIDEDGLVIGVQSVGQCPSAPNYATAVENPDFWDAMGLVTMTIDQRLDNEIEETVGSVGLWNGSTFGPRITVPKIQSFGLGSVQVLHADTAIYQNQKYNSWNNLADVVNHRGFFIDNSISVLVSFLRPTHGGVAVKTDLIDAPGTTADSIQFRDPWFIDYPDPLYGNSRRNRGKDLAVWYTRKSPFYPDTASFDGNVYNGVFLNQEYNIPGNPHYTVRAKQSIPISGITSYFQKWSGTYASFQDSSAMETPVVFTSSSAVAVAKYKAHLYSNSSSVTAPNGQRKIIRDNSGNYHMVYESAGEIFYTKSTDGGTSWSAEKHVSNYAPDPPYPYNRTPSLTVQDNPHQVIVVWDASANNPSDLVYVLARTIDPVTGAFGAMETVVEHSITPQAVGSPTPVVGCGFSGSSRFVLVAWYDPVDQKLRGRARSSSGVWGNTLDLDSGLISSITLSPIAQTDNWGLAWVKNYTLHFMEIIAALNITPGTIETVASGTEDVQNLNPSVAIGWDNGPFHGVSW